MAEHQRPARRIQPPLSRQSGQVVQVLIAELFPAMSVVYVSCFVVQQPAVMIPRHSVHVCLPQQLAGAIDAAAAIGDVPRTDHGVDLLGRKPVECELEPLVLAVQVPDNPEAFDWTRIHMSTVLVKTDHISLSQSP
jgi:hypothetical protein